MNIFRNIFFAAVTSAFIGSSIAQVPIGSEPTELLNKSAVDSYGVDVISGDALVDGIFLSIGAKDNGISIRDTSFNGMRTIFQGSISSMRSSGQNGGCRLLPIGTFIRVSTGTESAIFKYLGAQGAQQLVRGRGGLTLGNEAHYRDLSGTLYKYYFQSSSINTNPLPQGTGQECLQSISTSLYQIERPSGEIIDISYEHNAANMSGISKLVSVKSSLGWLFKREVVSGSGSISTAAGRSLNSEFMFINLTHEYCNPTASASCRNSTLPWAKYLLNEYHLAHGETGKRKNSFSAALTNSLGKVTHLSYSYTEPVKNYDVRHVSPTGIVKVYNKRCSNDCVLATESRRVNSITYGATTISGYGSRGLEPSGYANPSYIPREAFGPEGKVTYVPGLAEYPFHFTDNLSRTYVTGHNSQDKYLLDTVGYLNDSMTKAVHDSRGNITSITQQPKVVGPAPIVTSFTYPAESTCASSPKICNKPISITESNGVTTTYTYHAQSGYVETVTKPAVNGVRAQTRYKYEQKNPYVKNSSGNLVANPAVWVLTEVSECMTATLNTCVNTADEKRTIYSNFTNNLLAQKTTVRDGTGSIKLETLTEYDIYGNVVAVDGPRPGTDDKVFYFYDLMRQKIGEIGVDPDGTGPLPRQAIKTVYNADGKIINVDMGVTFGTSKADLDSMTVKQKTATEYSKDHGLPIVERFYAAGVLEKVTQKSYDNKLRLECVAQRLNKNAWSSLPSSACSLGVVGSEGNDRITKYTYDATGAVLSTISAFGTPLQRADRTNKYSSINGLLISEADAKGNLTSYKYDEFNRLFKTVYPTPASGTVESTTDYTQTNYKSGSSLVSSVRLRDGLTVNFSEYDSLGRVKTKSGALSESFTYNNFNQVLTHTNNSTGGVSQTSTYVFNSLGWLKSETRVAGGVSLGNVSYGYDGVGRRTSLTWPDNFSVKYDYNVNGAPGEYLRKITESNGTLLAQFDYYDNGLRKSLTRGNGVITSYNYNNLYQLKTQSTDVGGNSTADDISETFTYTQAGQLKTHLLNVNNNNYRYAPSAAAAINYVPDALNRISTLNGAAFTYDGRGNLTKDNTGATYTYNANNLMLNATKSGVATTLSYDAENRLFSVVKSGSTTKFVYDGTDLIAETNASNVIQRRYVHGPETDDPIVWYEGAGTTDKRYYTANRQGSIVGVTLQNGLSTSVNAYDEYGIQKLSTIGRFQYTGQTWIPEVGLYYYKARFYSPSLGRFMQTDPIGYKDGMNWYAYVGNDPVNMTDPTGLCPMCIGALVGMTIELGFQVVTGDFALNAESGSKILLAGAAGATGSGLAAGAARLASTMKLGAASKAGLNLASDAGASIAGTKIQGGEVTTDSVISDIIGGKVGGVAASGINKSISKSTTFADKAAQGKGQPNSRSQTRRAIREGKKMDARVNSVRDAAAATTGAGVGSKLANECVTINTVCK